MTNSRGSGAGHAQKKTPAKQLDREIHAVLSGTAHATQRASAVGDPNYRVAYGLVTRRDGKVVVVRAIVDAPRPLTLAEAEAWRRKWGRSATAWVETMSGEHVPVKGALRPGKFVDDAHPGDVHASLTSTHHATKIGPNTRAGLDQQARTAQKDFGKEVLAGLLKRGIRLTGTTWLPGPGGDYANGERGYQLDDNGTHKVRDYRGVLSLAGF